MFIQRRIKTPIVYKNLSYLTLYHTTPSFTYVEKIKPFENIFGELENSDSLRCGYEITVYDKISTLYDLGKKGILKTFSGKEENAGYLHFLPLPKMFCLFVCLFFFLSLRKRNQFQIFKKHLFDDYKRFFFDQAKILYQYTVSSSSQWPAMGKFKNSVHGLPHR